MARVYLTGSTTQKVLYTVDQTVGLGGPNKHDDVFLVQLFLRVQMEDGGSEAPYRPPGRRPLAIDGVCGNETLAYIRFFQEEAQRRFPQAPVPDGRVDPMRSGSIFASITHKEYMIASLNVGYRDKRGGDMYLDIGKDPLFPAALRKSFYIG